MDDDAEAITFGTDGWRAPLEEFTDERVRMVGQAVAEYVGDGTVAVGYDARESSPRFAESLAAVLAGNGVDALVSEADCPTPVLAWTIADRDLAGGLMVTASHNPPEYNGVKFLPPTGAPAMPEVTDALEARLGPPRQAPEGERGTVGEDTFTPAYCQHALAFTGADLEGLRVAYDAMHGSGKGVTDALLAEAGATVERLRCDPDPAFGGVGPEPSAERLADLVARVTEGDADLGLANDGDADRLAVVTPERGYLDPNLLLAVLYDYLLGSGAGPAVRTVSTTFLIDRVAEAHGERAVETPVGFKHVASAMREHGALVGGEESGGFGVTDHLPNKDGVALALLVAAAHAERPLDDRADAITERFGTIHQDRLSVDCPEGRKAPALAALGEALPAEIAGVAVESVNEADGFKTLLSDGSWLLVRPSGTEPKLRVYAEAGSDERVAELLAAGRELVEPLVQGS